MTKGLASLYIYQRDKTGRFGTKMLLGSYSARFDSSGRIKIPQRFRTFIEEKYGKEVFITSLTDESVQIYPMEVWAKLTNVTTHNVLQFKPDVRWFKLRVSRKGTPYEIDSKGRVLISQALRERTNLDEEVELIGLDDHIEVWNRDILDDKLDKNPLTDKDFEQISKLGRKEGEE